MRSELFIQPVDNATNWNEDASDFKLGIFNSHRFLEAMQNEKRKPVYFNIIENNEIIAKIAGLEIASGLGQRILQFYSGPVERYDGNKYSGEIVKALIRHAVSLKINRVVVRCYDYCRVFASSSRSFRCIDRSEYIVNLNSFSDDICRHFKKSVRRNIRRAEGFHPIFRVDSSPNTAERLLELLKQTQKIRTSKGYGKYCFFYMPYLEESSFFKLAGSEIGRLYYLMTDDKIRCVQLVLLHKNRAYSLLMGTSADGYRQGLPTFLDLKVMEQLRSEGVEYFNMGGVADKKRDAGLIAYKQSIGGIECIMTGGSTNYLRLPFAAMNPLLNIGRSLPNSAMKRYLKKIFD